MMKRQEDRIPFENQNYPHNIVRINPMATGAEHRTSGMRNAFGKQLV